LRIRFRLRAGPLLAALACIAVAIAIGNVQRGRAEQKQGVFDRMRDASRNAPIQVGALPADAARLDWHPVVVRGRWLSEKSILIDNKVHNGIAGYHVITPLRIEGANIGILVNRGWIAAPRLRTDLPLPPRLADSMADVQGIARLPPAKAYELAQDRTDGRVWQNLSLERFRGWSGLDLQPLVLLQTDAAGDGLVRDWLPAESGALKHWGFALLWYLAAVLAAMAALLSIVERRNHEA